MPVSSSLREWQERRSLHQISDTLHYSKLDQKSYSKTASIIKALPCVMYTSSPSLLNNTNGKWVHRCHMRGGFSQKLKWKDASSYHCSFSAWQHAFIPVYIPNSDQNPIWLSKRNTGWRAPDYTSNWYSFKHCAHLISLTSNTFVNLILYTS